MHVSFPMMLHRRSVKTQRCQAVAVIGYQVSGLLASEARSGLIPSHYAGITLR